MRNHRYLNSELYRYFNKNWEANEIALGSSRNVYESSRNKLYTKTFHLTVNVDKFS
jgi:hypothetical protein